jgi:hypothetical protein
MMPGGDRSRAICDDVPSDGLRVSDGSLVAADPAGAKSMCGLSQRLMCALAVTCALAAATLLAGLGLAPGARAATFGADVGGLFLPGKAIDATTLTKLRALRATGATAARTDTFWQLSEPAPPDAGGHHYDWTYDDAVAGALAAAGLRWEPVIDYAALWAGNPGNASNEGVAPAHVGDYSAYAQALAGRYGQGGIFWNLHPGLPQLSVNVFEIWNEPDLAEYWSPQPDLAEYATMFLTARSAIRARDPAASVIIGGLVFPRQSLPTLVQDRPELRGNVDGVGVHPYRSTAALTLTSVGLDLQTDAATVGAPLYVNEYGWGQPNPLFPAVTEASRDADIAQATQQLGADPYIADVEIYCWGCGPESDIFGSSYELYGTPGAAAFAAGIAADRPPAPPKSQSDRTHAVASRGSAPAPERPPSAFGRAIAEPQTVRRARTHRRHHHRHHHRRVTRTVYGLGVAEMLAPF